MSSQLSTQRLVSEINTICQMIKAKTPLIVIDIFATGNDVERDRLLSLSAIKIVEDDDGFPNIQEDINVLINPQIDVSASLYSHYGLKKSDIENALTEQETFKEVCAFLGHSPLIANFNKRKNTISFLNAMYERCSGEKFRPSMAIDVLDMTRSKLDIDIYSVETVTKELGIDQHLDKSTRSNVIGIYRIFRQMKTEWVDHNFDPNAEKASVEVIGIRYRISPDKKLAKMLIKTCPLSNTTFDLIQKTWFTDNDKIVLDDVRRQIFEKWGITNEAEMIQHVKQQILQKKEEQKE